MKKLLSLITVLCLMISVIPVAYAEEYINVYALDGRVEVIRKSDFDAWHAVGWYSEPVMTVYALDGRSEIIKISDFYAWHAVGWYSAPVMYVYAADGRKQVVTKSDAPLWKAVGWDYQTNYADNIPFTSDSQMWAVIDLKVGPYSDWKANRTYYINKYFSGMSAQDRANITDYKDEEHHMYLFIPRFKTTNTIAKAYIDFDDNYKLREYDVLWSIGNGLPFSVEIEDPAGDMNPIMKIRDNCGNEFVVSQNFSDEPWETFEEYNVLDLTEWKYLRY